MKSLKYLILLWAALLIACNTSRSDSSFQSEDSLTEETSLLRIYKDSLYTRVVVLDNDDSSRPVATYILVPDSCTLPGSLPEGTVVRTPVRNALVYSSVFASALKELGAVAAVRGVVDSRYFKIPEVRQGIETGSIVDAGAAASPTKEKIIEMQPDAIFLSIYEGMDPSDIENLGFPVVKMCDQLESTPLARAEWIKLLGLLTGRESEADSIFHSVKEKYNALKSKAKSVDNKPKILTDNLYQGVWYVPGGNSYQAQLIKDAGGNYFKASDESTGSLSLSFEQVLDEAEEADIWLLKLYGVGDFDYQALRNLDSRYLMFKPAKSKTVWWTDTSTSPLYEEFPFHPEFLLAEYIAIFHPQILPDYSFRYFKKIR